MGATSGPSPAPTSEPLEEGSFGVVGGQITVAASVGAPPGSYRRVPIRESICPGAGVEAEEPSRPGLHAAVQAIAGRYRTESGRSTGPWYTGLVTCEEGNFFTAFRVPGGAGFDAWIRKIARRHGVTAHFRDARYSRDRIAATGRQVTWRKKRLEQAGAHVRHMSYEYRDGGYLRVGIRGDLEAARHVLADLGDRVRLVEDLDSSAPN